MNEHVIRQEYSDDETVADYLCEVARRLDPLFPGGITEIPLGLSLFALLQAQSIHFFDGFVINDISDPDKIIGTDPALVVVAALDADVRPPSFWDSQRFPRGNDDRQDQMYRALKERIATFPGITRID
ncbi:MAG TPA: hypothetical protein VF432_23175 [Thermoanaerobaculia bacterium]